jgi:hypothetical protein
MTDSSGFEDPQDRKAGSEKPKGPELRGRYVEGDYGAAGEEEGRHEDDTEGQYIQGDYGESGEEGGLPEPLGGKAEESGRFAKGDYGRSGKGAGQTGASEIGRYTEGDYGADGKVDPTRKAATEEEDDSGQLG